MGVREKICLLCVILGGCSKTVSECTKDSDCTNIVYPFCDANGEYAASGGVHNVCTIVPPDCKVDRCGCAAGATTCSGSALTTCNTDQMSVTTVDCALGCASTAARCSSFKPSNGLDGAMNAAAGEPDLVLTDHVTIDTDACDMHDDVTGSTVAIKSLLIAQTSAPKICVFVAASLEIGDAVATGNAALAFAAPGPVKLNGMIDGAARPNSRTVTYGGPGALVAGICVGSTEDTESGGGGNATDGGAGTLFTSVGPHYIAGGLAQPNFSPLVGGCEGGGFGGGGGGAVQIDSLTSIEASATSLVALGGAGGSYGGAGGSGGTLVLESPIVTIAGTIAANGGGGGTNDLSDSTCATYGHLATNDNIPAPGGTSSCYASSGGAGGTAAIAPEHGHDNHTSGGGSVGRVLIRTADGTFVGPGPIFSVVKTLDTLQKI